MLTWKNAGPDFDRLQKFCVGSLPRVVLRKRHQVEVDGIGHEAYRSVAERGLHSAGVAAAGRDGLGVGPRDTAGARGIAGIRGFAVAGAFDDVGGGGIGREEGLEVAPAAPPGEAAEVPGETLDGLGEEQGIAQAVGNAIKHDDRGKLAIGIIVGQRFGRRVDLEEGGALPLHAVERRDTAARRIAVVPHVVVEGDSAVDVGSGGDEIARARVGGNLRLGDRKILGVRVGCRQRRAVVLEAAEHNVLVEEVLLLDVGEQGDQPGAVAAVVGSGWECLLRVGVVVDAETDLLEVVGALTAAGRFARRLHGGQQQCDEDADDRNHHQQLDQSETAKSGSHGKFPFKRRF